MTPQERDVIAGIFDRLKQAANQPRDPEAEQLIAGRLREQPYAPYAMAQAVYVQEQALTNLQAQVEQLQAQVTELQNQPKPQDAPAQGGFLSGIFGGAPKPADAAPRAGSVPAFPQRSGAAPSSAWNTQAAQQPGQGQMGGQQGSPQQGPWAGAQAQQAGRGGGFMASALTTAAGVAGGMMLGNVLTNAFGGHKAGEAKAAEPATAADTSKTEPADTAQPASDSTNYDDGSSGGASYQDAGYQEPVDPGYDDGSSFGDDDSWT